MSDINNAAPTPAPEAPAPEAPAPRNDRPTTIVAPTDPAERADWLMGKTPYTGDSAPSKTSSDIGHNAPETKGTPASEAGKKSTEATEKAPRSNADKRLAEILGDLRAAGLTPKLLKEKRSSDHTEPKTESEPTQQARSEKTPAYSPFDSDGNLVMPEKPDWSEYDNDADYRAADKQYMLDYDRYRDAKEQYNREMERVQNYVHSKLNEVRERYGDKSGECIDNTKKALWDDASVPSQIRELITESPVFADLIYVLGSDTKALAQLAAIAKQRPSAAARTVIALEMAVKQELGSSNKGASAGNPPSHTTNKKAYPPPDEIRAPRGSLPDDSKEAFKAGDFRKYREAENRRELARLQGR